MFDRLRQYWANKHALPTRLAVSEAALGTHSDLFFEFHRVVDDAQGLGLRFPGFLVGVEKHDRELIGVPDDDSNVRLENLRGSCPVGNDLHPSHCVGDRTKVLELLERRLDDGKRLSITHTVSYDHDVASGRIAAQPMLDLYADLEAIDTPEGRAELARDSYSRAWAEIPKLREALTEHVQRNGSSHLILYVMGWSSGQVEALRNVNSIHNRLLADCQAEHRDFRPTAMAVTWPSHWKWQPLSYINKANDADELGIVWLNAIIHQVLAPVAEEHGLATVCIGHSFGARAVSRALFSRELLPDNPNNGKVDLFIGLQSAVSINRFLIWDEAKEGSPYADFHEQVGKVALTWSKRDTANPIAFWSDHAGGERGARRADEYCQQFPDSNRISSALVSSDGDLHVTEEHPDSLLYIDASAIVNHANHAKGGGAHSDIYTPAMARLIANLVQRYAPGSMAAPQHSVITGPSPARVEDDMSRTTR